MQPCISFILLSSLCVTAKKKGGCHRKAVRKEAIEELVMRKTVQSVFECNAMDSLVEHLMMWQAKENTVVPLLQRELGEVEKSLENMARAIEQGIINPTTKKRMDELTAQKTDLEVKIAREEIQAQILTSEQVKFWLSKMIDLNLSNQDNRLRIIDTFINSIYVHDDRVIINFNCREESEVIPLQLNQILIVERVNWLYIELTFTKNIETGSVKLVSVFLYGKQLSFFWWILNYI